MAMDYAEYERRARAIDIWAQAQYADWRAILF